MAVMEKLRMFVAQEPVVAASCLMGAFGLFLPAVVRPMLDSFESSKQVPQPALSDLDQRVTVIRNFAYNTEDANSVTVVAGVTGKKQQ
ncbi:hypothetical protein WN944_017400 [Citrus x changshan-huyou]|uniref:Uncharacterized protein n=1 Tax=Citrus x changshan-huyou TaxID=2935761 RepID=A0AAP0QPG7_9ROSI